MTERKPCHNCRKRRLRCDRSVPACFKCSKTGQKCLGYGKLYRWIDPEAPVGQSAASIPSTESDSWVQSRARGGKSYSFNALGKVGDVPQQELDVFFANPPLTILLADPLLQDLGGPSRHYLSYFASRFCQDLVVHDSAERGTNPFRELIPMSQTYSYLQHIIIAASAVHYYHAISNSSTEEAGRSLVAQNALVDALQARQVAIKELIAIIQERRSGDPRTESQADQDALLATVLFFVNFTLIESGKDGWKDHLAAAGRLLSLHAPTSVPLLFCAGDDDQLLLDYSPSTSLDLVSLSAPSSFEELPEAPLKPLSACDYVTSDTVAYFIWNCALESLVSSRPSPSSSADSLDYAAQPLTWDVAQVLRIISRTEANSYHSCPSHLMGIVLRVARITRHWKDTDSQSPAAAQLDEYLSLLKEAEDFDVEAWAVGVSTRVVGMLGVMNEQELMLRCHIAATYRAGVCLYILLVAPGLPAEVRRRARLSDGDVASLPSLPTTEDLAVTMLHQLSSIPKTSPLFKNTLWPVFLTGLGAVSDAHRLWVIQRLRDMRDICPWGMMTSAMEVLTDIWQLRDGTVKGRVDEVGSSDEMAELEQAGEDNNDWLTRLRSFNMNCLIV